VQTRIGPSYLSKVFFIATSILLNLPLLAQSTPPVAQSQPTKAEKIIFAFYPSDKPSVVYSKFLPFVTYLQNEVNRHLKDNVKYEFEIVITQSYADHIKRMQLGEFDISRVGPASYTLLKQKIPNLKLLAIEGKKGKKNFYGHMIVYKSSTIRSVEDIKKLKKKPTFAFGNPNSTLGRYLPQTLLVENGLGKSAFSKINYLGRHDKVATAIIAGDYDIGSLKESTYKKYKSRGLVSIGKMKNMTKPWIAHPKLSSRLIETIQEILVNYQHKSQERTAALKKLKASGFFFAKDQDFNDLKQQMAKAQEFERY
jgi:phosphonate transport system substrate-binding protein